MVFSPLCHPPMFFVAFSLHPLILESAIFRSVPLRRAPLTPRDPRTGHPPPRAPQGFHYHVTEIKPYRLPFRHSLVVIICSNNPPDSTLLASNRVYPSYSLRNDSDMGGCLPVSPHHSGSPGEGLMMIGVSSGMADPNLD